MEGLILLALAVLLLRVGLAMYVAGLTRAKNAAGGGRPGRRRLGRRRCWRRSWSAAAVVAGMHDRRSVGVELRPLARG